MAAAVVADRRALVVRDLREVRDDVLDRLVSPLGPSRAAFTLST